MNPTTPEPPCPVCGGTPASMIEDCVSTDLTPWWRHYAQKFNPFRLIRRQTGMRWIPMGECDQAIWSHEQIVVRYLSGFVQVFTPCLHTPQDLSNATHWCPLPPLP